LRRAFVYARFFAAEPKFSPVPPQTLSCRGTRYGLGFDFLGFILPPPSRRHTKPSLFFFCPLKHPPPPTYPRLSKNYPSCERPPIFLFDVGRTPKGLFFFLFLSVLRSLVLFLCSPLHPLVEDQNPIFSFPLTLFLFPFLSWVLDVPFIPFFFFPGLPWSLCVFFSFSVCVEHESYSSGYIPGRKPFPLPSSPSSNTPQTND